MLLYSKRHLHLCVVFLQILFLDKIGLDARIYFCDCGYSQDRDIHSAKNILNEGLKISKELRNSMLVEKMLDFEETFVFDKQFSMKQEATSLKTCGSSQVTNQ